ncbi:MAG: DUF2877 domain-containing protein [Deltaproteobacteria bacterium]|nr:DUF2877 domain-containing protein [Deltaproteobacteria bacterium]
MNSLKAVSVGYRVKDLFEDRKTGQFHSVHSHSAYCSIRMRPLLLIHGSVLGGIPFGIGVDMGKGYFKEVGLCRGMRVHISDRSLCIPAADFCIEFGDAKVWYPENNRPAHFSLPRAEANFEQALQLVARMGSGQGLGELSLVLNDLFLEQGNGAEHLNLLCQACFEPLTQLISGIKKNDLAQVENALPCLIGLGIGLTPSMDDLITALISTLYLLCDRLPGGFEFVSAIGERISRLSRSRTTLVSHTNLVYASRGDRFEILDDLIWSILSSSGEDLVEKVGKLISFGATSGTELAIGLLLGMKLALDGGSEMNALSMRPLH